MKHYKSLLLIATLCGLFLTSCKKDTDCNDSPQTESVKLLTAGPWIQTDAKYNDINLWELYEDCYKDNFYTYFPNGTVVFDNGETKCDPSDPQTETGNWQFLDNETKLTQEGETYDIDILTNNKLVLSVKEGDDVFIFDYKRK